MWPFRKKEQRASIEDPRVSISDPQVLELVFGQQPTESGVQVSADTALQVPSIWCAINFLSGTIASLPLKVYRETEDGREEATTNPWSMRLGRAANESWTSYRWRKYSMTRTLLGGRSFTFIERQTKTLWPLPPSKVKKERRDGEIKYIFGDGQDKKVYDENEILDIPFMLDEDPLQSVNPVMKLKNTIGLSIALQDFASRHFRNGGMPPAVLQGPAMSAGAAKRASDDIKQAIASAMREGRIPALPEGYEMKTLGSDPEKSQMEASRRFQVEEVARVYDLPPVFLQDLTHGTFSNTEQQDLHFVKHSLTQWLRCWEQEINLKLFRHGAVDRRTADSRHFAEFSVDGLLRGDFKTRMDGWARAVQNGIRTPNEVRARENLPPKKGGNDLYLQQNMSQLEMLDSLGMPTQGEEEDNE